jgi:hypothetical protein
MTDAEEREVICNEKLRLPTAAFYARGLQRRCDFFVGCGHEAQACFIDPNCTVVSFICPCCIARCRRRNPNFLSFTISLVACDGGGQRKWQKA